MQGGVRREVRTVAVGQRQRGRAGGEREVRARLLVTTEMSSSPEPFNDRLIAVGGTSSTGPSAGRLEHERHPLLGDGEALAGAQQERHAAPAVRVDPHPRRDERVGVGVVGDALDVAVAVVLAEHDLVGVQRAEAGDHRLPGLEQVAGPQRRRRLHGDLGGDLEQVRDDHVQGGAGRVVEPGTVVDVEGLGHVDLHLRDAPVAPDVADDRVREPQDVQVLRRLLPEEVVEAVDLLLVEDAVDHLLEVVEGRRARAVGLLEHHPRALREPVGVERLHVGLERRGRQGDVVHEQRRRPAPTCSRARATVAGRSPGSSTEKPLPANIRWPSTAA